MDVIYVAIILMAFGILMSFDDDDNNKKPKQ
jgi:hypothetical protein